jgi:hypothetical protein
MKQEASIYLLVLRHLTRHFEQVEGHVEGTFEYYNYKQPLLAGQSLVALQLSHMSHSTHDCFEKIILWSKF